jgi:hypothetical protein
VPLLLKCAHGGEIVETVVNVALNIFENYMSHVARFPVDFRSTNHTRHQAKKTNQMASIEVTTI